MEDISLTTEQAYLAKYEYFVKLFHRTNSDELGALLAGMSYLKDGATADPAAWKDWMKCVLKVLNEGSDAQLKLR